MVASGAIWRDQLAAGERAALGRGAGFIPEPRPDVLIVGGGIVGAATAAACHEAGLGSVLLIEAGQLGSGATGGAAGLLTPEIREWSDPGPFADLARASLEHWKDLELSHPGGVGLIHLDWIGLVPDPDSFAPHQLPAVEWLMPDQVHDLVPDLALPMAGARIRHQARVNPLRAIARLTAALPDVATGVAAVSATIRGGRVVTVGTSAGDIHPGVVVFATGWPPVLDGLPLDVPSDVVKGHLLVTEPVPLRLPGTVAPVATQLEDGRLLVGGTFDTGDEGPSLRPEVIEAILGGLYAALPALRRRRRLASVVLLPASPSRRAPGHRQGARPRQRLAHLWALPYRHPHGAGDGADARPVDRGRRATGRGPGLEQRQVHQLGTSRSLTPEPA